MRTILRKLKLFNLNCSFSGVNNTFFKLIRDIFSLPVHKMKRYKVLLIFFLYSIQNLNEVNSIRCYQCSSADDPEGEDNCGAYEDFHREKHVPVECNTDESKSPGTFCMKFTQQSPRGYIWDGRWRQVIRRCASVAENGVTGVCNWGVMENGVYWEKCYCSEHGCNSASIPNLSFISILLTSTLYLYCVHLV